MSTERISSVHVLPHTHWDREWYEPYSSMRLRLVELLDELLPRLESDPAFTHFQLDGQMAVIDDYLTVRPDDGDRLAELNRSGRISMGPWYTLPDEFLVSGETLVRDLQLGISRAERFGGAMNVGYLPDMFGHIAQMPQIFSLLGMDQALVWRGVPSTMTAPAFWWRSPDGTEVRTEYLPSGYFNGSNTGPDPDEFAERIDTFLAFQGDLVGDRVLWMAGMDHEVPPAHLPEVIAGLAAKNPGYSIEMTSLEQYLQGAPTDGLPTLDGEMRSGARANLLMGVASNRVDVKVAAAKAEFALERFAEPLDALWQSAPGRWQALFDLAWLELVRNAAHDSICACSHDEVVDAVLLRYAEATTTADAIAARAVADAGRRFAEPGVYLLNAAAASRGGVAELTLPADAPAPASVQVLAEFPAEEALHTTGAEDAPLIIAREMLAEHPDTVAVRIDEGTTPLRVHLLPVDEPGALSISDGLGDIGQRCAADPELQVTTVLHRANPTRTVLARVEPVPGFGWSRFDGAAPGDPVVAHGEHGLSNGPVTVEVDPANGTFSVNGLSGLGRLVDDGDAGDTYNWCPPHVDSIVDAATSITVTRSEVGPVRGRLHIDATYVLPAEVVQDGDEWVRGVDGAPTIDQQVRTTIELRAGEDFVRVTVDFHNRVRDHRLRAHFPLPERADHSEAECAFAVVDRPLWLEGGPNEWGVPTAPSRRFVSAGGLTITHEGLCEYELVDLDGDAEAAGTTAGELALTLVRSTGWLSRGPMLSRPLPAGPLDLLEGAQTLKPLSLRYAVGIGVDDPYRFADDVWNPLVAVSSDGDGDLPETGSWIDVSGAAVDSLLRQGDRWVLRVHESTGSPGELVVTGATGEVIDLLGNVVEPFDGTLALRPFQIVTLSLPVESQ